jgi:hypothetical protein
LSDSLNSEKDTSKHGVRSSTTSFPTTARRFGRTFISFIPKGVNATTVRKWCGRILLFFSFLIFSFGHGMA